MNTSSISPLNKSKRSGDWKESPARPSPVTGLRKSEKNVTVYGKSAEKDASSFSELLARAMAQNAKPEDDLQALMHIMSGGNDRIRNMALGLTSPIPRTDALLDVTIARARVVPYGPRL